MTEPSATFTEQGVLAGVQLGIISLDEARAFFGLSPLPVLEQPPVNNATDTGPAFTGLSLV